ncbi:hypothetical protein C1H76_8381 [Elsinoe australis]|uniref:Uncharacterized protein n=1 Tax=Elsinoe australis TaxID=40998 RepID=A0A4V6DT72_9PEZI|nr:hypothetical protein C1H76_8381 [Elsinoe australis]
MTSVIAPPPPTATALAGLTNSPKERMSSPLRYAGLPPRSMSTSSSNGAHGAPPVHASPNITSAPNAAASRPPRSSPRSNGSPESAARSPPSRTGSAGKASPNSQRAPMIRVKKEPASPQMSSRPRPRRLDLSSSASALRGPQTAGANPSAPLPSKESAGLAIKDLGVACLSPGFQTQDPTLRSQLQRSLSVRDQQRQLIEARQKGSTKPLTSHGTDPAQRPEDFNRDGPQTSRRKGPPPGLSIHAPSASSFAHERVIQSAPLGQSFTGLRQHNIHPHSPSHLGQSSHVQHVPAQQTANRLPPISDVFAHDRMEAPPSASFRPAGPPAPSPGHPPMQSPGFPPNHHHHPSAQPSSSRSREFRSAEEAVQSMAAGREELLPKVVHYGGAQPPTPPSPGGHHRHHQHPRDPRDHRDHPGYPSQHHSHTPQMPPSHFESRPDLGRTQSISGRRRGRDEYERDNGGSPAVHPGEFKRHAPGREEDDWRHGMSSREKREEFLRLCERAWDLFHS